MIKCQRFINLTAYPHLLSLLITIRVVNFVITHQKQATNTVGVQSLHQISSNRTQVPFTSILTVEL